MTERKHGGAGYWIFLAVFTLLLAAFWGLLIGYVYQCMMTYEAAQPERLVERTVRDLGDGSLLDTLEFPHSRFEDEAACRSAYAAAVEGKELTFQKTAGSYDALSPVYEVLAGDSPVATVALRAKSSRTLMLLLTLQEWELDSVTPVLELGGAWTIVAPDTFTVRVNGQKLDGREFTGERQEIEEFRYAAEYTDVPALVEYRVEGLIQEPEVEVLDNLGRPVETAEDGERRLRADQFAPSEMDEGLAHQVLKNAEDYSDFFSGDLEGSSRSTRPIRHMFPEGSYYLELAENYRLHDMWMYASHHAPVFSQEQVSSYIEYGDDFFSCEVYFDKKMVISSTGQVRHDITHTRYFYVRQDGRWVIADMQQII